jgi:hypothetical protein
MMAILTPRGRGITLSEHVTRLYLDYDTREVIEIIERERGQIIDQEGQARRRRTIIEMCSRLHNRGTLSQAKQKILPDVPDPILHIHGVDQETRAYYSVHTRERKMILNEGLRRFLVWGADEDLFPLCPTLPPIGGV